jgi:prevent-host-death family protein
MAETVGVRELRQNLSVYLRRVRAGERLIVTERNVPVAELTPLGASDDPWERMIREGRLIPAQRPGGFKDLPPPLPMDPDDPYAATRALEEQRRERF